MADTTEELLHWADEKEVISSNKPLKLLLLLFKLLPSWVVHLLIFPVSFFYFIFSERARSECKNYQKLLKEYTNGKAPARISSYRQIASFSLCVLEKLEGWLGKVKYDKIICHDDDLQQLISQLENKKGAILFGSHLGNIELLRSLSTYNETGVSRSVPVTTIMEMKSTEQFNKTLQEVNPDVSVNVIDPQNINPETTIQMQETIDNGGLVVVAGDRTSARARARAIRAKFLGKEADFPYGVFLIAALLKCPIYYCFGLRNKTVTLFPKYHMHIEKSEIDFDCSRKERDQRIKKLCLEYVQKLEKYCAMYPYQWYNFYNFWLLHEDALNFTVAGEVK